MKIDKVNNMLRFEVLRYGMVLTDDEFFGFYDSMSVEVRIRTVFYEGNIYYIKMVNGEIEELKKLEVGR